MIKNLVAKLGIIRLILLVIALLLILLSWQQVLSVRRDLTERTFERDGIPMRLIAPAGAMERPAVLIAHGFGGSQQIMLGYAYTLAKAGYTTLLWDFGGHAANSGRLNREGESLQEDLDAAYAVLIAQPEADPDRIALLGHSMGSGAVMEAGIRTPERYQAVVAVSPTGADVTAEQPPNLLLQAGERESRFVANAEELLDAAGGPSEDFAQKRARAFELIPEVEHITILFSPRSHASALEWLDAAFAFTGAGVEDRDYTDARILWYLLHLSGWLLAVVAVSPLLPKSRAGESRSVRAPWHVVALLLAPFAATLLLALTNALFDVTQIGGLLVGVGFSLWCLYFGLFWLLSGFRLRRFPFSDAAFGLLLFVVLWLAFGALAQLVWLPWLLTPARLLRWPLLALAFFPWMWASGQAQQRASAGRRALWWLAQSAALVVGILLAIQAIPGMSVLILVMPLVPLLLGIMTITGAAFDRPAVNGIGHALFFAWLILAYFPMV